MVKAKEIYSRIAKNNACISHAIKIHCRIVDLTRTHEMYCPFCGTSDTKVIDSRLIKESNQVRRRRTCLQCRERFTSYETVELTLPRVIKRDGKRSVFQEQKLRSGMLKAMEKRPISMDQIDAAVSRIMKKAMTCGEREISTQDIGQWVMNELQQLDQVAYVRFASVYRSFTDIHEFEKEINRLTQHAKQSSTPTKRRPHR